MSKAESGFTLVEMLIVITIIGIITGIAIFALSSSRTAYAADDAANMVVNYCREASGRAIATHHSFRVVINLNTRVITMINENTFDQPVGNGDTDTIAGDDTLVKQQPLNSEVKMNPPPAGVGLPPAPFAYPAATYSSNVWCAHFQSDGSATSGATGPLFNCTLFFQSALATGSQQKSLIRAVSLFGTTSSVRFWLYSGTAFTEG